uniref:UDP-glucose ceramide glucosyltransferase-like 1 n=1 Tax=Otolemur garnettii TaxID=30611 RepID=H0WPZ6_OTOGA
MKAANAVRRLLGFSALWLSLLGAGTVSASKAVTARLAAKWPETPLLLEASEFMAEESNEKFWQFLETVQELAIYKQTESDYSYYSLILKKAGQFLDNLHINLLKFALSIRAYSPAIQMFQQIAADEPPPDGCNAFVVIHKKHTCKINEIRKLLKKATSRPRPYLFKEDHKFPTNKENIPVIILYAEMGTRAFSAFHKVLSEKAQNGEILYVFRHYIQKPSSRKMYLSGYGVELAIKSTEYKALDDSQVKKIIAVMNATAEDDTEANEVQGFLFGKLKEIYPALKDNLTAFQKYLIESNKEMIPLKVWELQDLSFQAASQIMSTPVYDAIKLMKDISQNFPIKARSLTRIAVNQHMRKEIHENQKDLRDRFEIQPGNARLFINGLHVDMDVYDPFSIVGMLKLEGKIMSGLHSLGINGEDTSKFLKLSPPVWENNYILDIRHSSIMWINDLENDELYVTWPASCHELLKPIYPGSIPNIRRNFHNLVLFIDPAQEYTLDFIQLAELFYFHKIPLRIGFVFILNTDDEVNGASDAGVALWRAFNYIAEEYDELEAFISIVHMYENVKDQNILTVDDVKNVLQNKFPHANIWDILGIYSKYDREREAGANFYKMTGLGPLPQALYNGEPFSNEELNIKGLEMAVLHRMMDTSVDLQREVFMGTLNDLTNTIDFLMNKNNVVPRINSLILHTTHQYLNLISTSVTSDIEDFSTFFFLDSQDKSAVIAKNMYYLTPKDDSVISAVTLWIIADFDKPSGRKLLFYALKHMKTSIHCRLGVIYNPTSKINEENTAISRGILAAFLTQKNSFLRSLLMKLAKEETAKAIYSGEKIQTFLTEGMDKNTFEKKYNTIGVNVFRTHQLFCQDVLKLRPGELGIVSNGKFLGPLDKEFYVEDFYLLEKMTFSNSLEKIKGIVENMDINSKNMSDLIMKVDALICSLPKRASRYDVTFLKENHSIIKINPQENDMVFDVIAIVDPLTREAQKMAQLLVVLGKIINMKIKLFMNCKGKLSEAPLKSFYRFVLEPELISGANDIPSLGPVAKFLDIPESPLLTLNMITPEGWLVETVHSNCDLDNIHLKDTERTVMAEYELEYLLLEGHCFDTMTEQPPQGLQFTLGTKNKPVMVDTIVMANLGYFQLKANPGAWILKLRQGKSEDIYEIVGHDGTDSQPELEDVLVVLNSFKSKILQVQVQKKPDKIKEDILTDKDEKQKGMWDSIKRCFTISLHKEDKKEKDVLNIFSVASGHLYERFLRIMMLSVLRNTKTPVKFWFLKNYLSPTFKEIIPYMAKEYGFQYELVQYKWPRWLHPQTEKQRIIWGYKILFLDVLFPLAVDKIIFVDADQIVRHDLKELRDFNLDGAPYGYTPFCDSRTEMDGYRFWKKGYWASHLLRRKYHISALYVVDLKKFRRIAAGDRLRGQYQALSQDPNSLSNLDQDLPNNMIYQVAIKSLPQDWLWCETWCDDESKQRAKTIDLCNNPKTKEPKLKAAARIVPEWVEYDAEIKQLLDHLENKKENEVTLSKGEKDKRRHKGGRERKKA